MKKIFTIKKEVRFHEFYYDKNNVKYSFVTKKGKHIILEFTDDNTPHFKQQKRILPAELIKSYKTKPSD